MSPLTIGMGIAKCEAARCPHGSKAPSKTARAIERRTIPQILRNSPPIAPTSAPRIARAKCDTDNFSEDRRAVFARLEGLDTVRHAKTGDHLHPEGSSNALVLSHRGHCLSGWRSNTRVELAEFLCRSRS